MARSYAPNATAASANKPASKRAESRLRKRNSAPGVSSKSRLYIQLFYLPGSLHDEFVARADVLAHQVIDGLLGRQFVARLDGHLQCQPPSRVQRGALQFIGGHFAQTLEAHDVGLGVAFGLLFDDAVALGLVQRPIRFLA